MRLTRDEIFLVTGILLALTVGAVVKQYRETKRVQAIQQAVSREDMGRSAAGEE